MVAKSRPVKREEFSFQEESYLPEIMKGLRITSRRFVRNLFGKKDTVTLQYPEVKKSYPERFRGRHRLMHREDDQVRCVACMMCSTACPSNCITIDAGEHESGSIEKFPVKFEIDLLLCFYCGFREEACPCDAIRMDSGRHAMPTFSRDPQTIGKVDLMEIGSTSIAKQGGENA